jgi:hypothetical protein
VIQVYIVTTKYKRVDCSGKLDVFPIRLIYNRSERSSKIDEEKHKSRAIKFLYSKDFKEYNNIDRGY